MILLRIKYYLTELSRCGRQHRAGRWCALWLAASLPVASQVLPEQRLPLAAAATLLAQGPVQTGTRRGPVLHGHAHLTPQAEFRVAGRVLARRFYYADRFADFAPVDLLLGWGPMRTSSFLQRHLFDFYIEQRTATLEYSTRLHPPSGPELDLLFANIHLIPANAAVRDYLRRRVKVDDVVYLEGELVNAVLLQQTAQWNTSLRRDDTEDGACEILLVRRIAHVR